MNSSDCLKANLSEPKITRRVALMGAAASVFPSAWSQVRDAYRIVVPFPAGGGMDAVARVLGNHLGSKLKQTVVVENRPGAGGAIGTQYVRQQNGNGNIALITTASFVATPLLNPGANYNPVADFQPICGIFDSYPFVIVNGALPANNIAELIQFAKKSQHPIEVGTSGLSGSSHVASLYLAKQAGIEILPVPYKGVPEMELAVVTGDVKLIFTTPSPSGVAHVKEGKLKYLGVSSAKRLPSLPEVSTISEAIPNFLVEGWGGLYAPLGVASERVEQVSAAIQEVVQEQDFKKLMQTLMFTERFYTGPQFKEATSRLFNANKEMLRAVEMKQGTT